MNNSKQAEKAQVEKSAPKKPVLTDFEKKIEQYQNLHSKVKNMQTLKNHLQKLNGLKIPQENQPFEENREQTEKIILYVGYKDEYEIKNPTLMLELKNFLISKLETKVEQLETEIVKTEV